MRKVEGASWEGVESWRSTRIEADLQKKGKTAGRKETAGKGKRK